MIAVIFHQGFRFSQPLVMEQLLGLEVVDAGATKELDLQVIVPVDDMADLVLHDEIGPMMTAAMRALN